jgi:hypothetical protein
MTLSVVATALVPVTRLDIVPSFRCMILDVVGFTRSVECSGHSLGKKGAER